VPVASEGIAPAELPTDRVGEGSIGACFVGGDVVRGTGGPGAPLAVVPLRVGDQPVGAVAVFELLEQKSELLEADFELLRMLATQGATALAGAQLFSAAGGEIPKFGPMADGVVVGDSQ
jgi:hypothetical protein